MRWKTLKELKTHLKKAGFEKKAILDDEEMAHVIQLLDRDKRALDTPPPELRYIEGLLNLPLGYLESFKVIPKPGHEKCQCGRVPSALDIVSFAFSRHIHQRELLRDTLLGVSNMLEIAEEGRAGECYHCGRTLIMFSYWTTGYAYA
jgi:hypothetical protein